MALSRKDAYATLFIAAGLLLALSVIQGWGWPIMSGTRMGIIGLGVTGMVACSVSGWAGQKVSYSNPFMIAGIVLGVVALAVAVVGLFANATVYLAVMMATVSLLWLVTVVHRIFSGTLSSRAVTAS